MGSLIFYGVMLACVLGALAGAFLHVKGIGYDERSTEVAPVMAVCQRFKTDDAEKCADDLVQTIQNATQLQANNDQLTERIGRQNKAMGELELAGSEARARTAKAKAEAAADTAHYNDRIAELKARIDQPSGEPNAEADRILRALAIDRLRH